MVCLIKQNGAEIVAWFIGPTIESVILQCDDDALTKEVMSGLPHYSVFGNYRLQAGRYTLLVGSGDARERGLVQAG